MSSLGLVYCNYLFSLQSPYPLDTSVWFMAVSLVPTSMSGTTKTQLKEVSHETGEHRCRAYTVNS